MTIPIRFAMEESHEAAIDIDSSLRHSRIMAATESGDRSCEEQTFKKRKMV